MKLTEFVIKEAILPSLSATTKEEVIREMVAHMKSVGALKSGDEEAVVAAILKREELGSTGIGNGVAVPHTKHACVEKLSAMVAISRKGVKFASLDGEDVFILFLLVSPPDRPGDHLRGLENISRHLRSKDFCNFLQQSSTTEAIWSLLSETDENDAEA
ncbi:MAG TPA: PTS sugar transporter subunit IIA [Planctomycetaceae bacterium]|nr:PTS sugar transporter subunit IIA [Planctomycetaceae bacterium]HRA87720.1 PTS sugar transporter subunit IIA [Planctomycetaceae bacterium]